MLFLSLVIIYVPPIILDSWIFNINAVVLIVIICMDHKLPGYETAIEVLVIVSQWLPRRNTGKSDNLTDHFKNIEIHTCTHTFFLNMFQQLGGNGSKVNLMPINWEFLKLQFDTKQSSVLRKKYPRKKRTRIRPSYTTRTWKTKSGIRRKSSCPFCKT